MTEKATEITLSKIAAECCNAHSEPAEAIAAGVDVLDADPVPAPGQVWGDAHRQILVLSGGTGVVLAGMDTWARGGWMSLVEAGRVLRENGYRYLGEAEIVVKGKGKG